MEKIVEYDSKMNELNFGKFKEKELDLFFSICYKMKNEGINEITLPFQELKELSKYSRNDLKRFVKDLENTYTKLLDMKFEILISSKVREKFVLFTRYRIDEEKKEITIQLHEEYNFILNDIARFTKFDLMEFVSLKSSYSKNMFKLLKQFDNENKYNWYQVKLDDLKVILDIPNSYKMSHIDSFVLSPILKQLTPYFNNLKLEKIKKGVKVESLKFTWKAKKKKQVEQSSVIKKKQFLGEKDLKEYQDQSQEREENKLVNQVEKIKISKADHKKLYEKHLEEIGETHNPFIEKAFDIASKSKYEVIEFEQPKLEQTKIYTVEDIPEEKLLDKNGNKLRGILLNNRVNKILKEMNAAVY